VAGEHRTVPPEVTKLNHTYTVDWIKSFHISTFSCSSCTSMHAIPLQYIL